MASGLNTIANLLGKVNASNALVVTLSGGTASATTFLAGDGTAAAPSYSFTSEPNTGLYHTGVDASSVLNLSMNGTAVAQVDTTGSLFLVRDAAAFQIGITSPVVLSRGAANRLDLATGDSAYLVSGGLGIGAIETTAGYVTAASRIQLGGLAAAATSYTCLIKKTTAMGDGSAVSMLTVTVPNASTSAVVKCTLLSANGSTDAFESSRTAQGAVVIARTAGVATVAVVSTLDALQIATVAAGATHTLAYAVSAMSGLTSAPQTFTIDVTVNDSGNVGANQCVALFELINAEASGVTIA